MTKIDFSSIINCPLEGGEGNNTGWWRGRKMKKEREGMRERGREGMQRGGEERDRERGVNREQFQYKVLDLKSGERERKREREREIK